MPSRCRRPLRCGGARWATARRGGSRRGCRRRAAARSPHCFASLWLLDGWVLARAQVAVRRGPHRLSLCCFFSSLYVWLYFSFFLPSSQLHAASSAVDTLHGCGCRGATGQHAPLVLHAGPPDAGHLGWVHTAPAAAPVRTAAGRPTLGRGPMRCSTGACPAARPRRAFTVADGCRTCRRQVPLLARPAAQRGASPRHASRHILSRQGQKKAHHIVHLLEFGVSLGCRPQSSSNTNMPRPWWP